jgi:hypothetical protein
MNAGTEGVHTPLVICIIVRCCLFADVAACCQVVLPLLAGSQGLGSGVEEVRTWMFCHTGFVCPYLRVCYCYCDCEMCMWFGLRHR